jgi:hypothetical protein
MKLFDNVLASLSVVIVCFCILAAISTVANDPHSPFPLVGFTAAKQDMAYEILPSADLLGTGNGSASAGSRVLSLLGPATVSRSVVRSSGKKLVSGGIVEFAEVPDGGEKVSVNLIHGGLYE